MKNIRKKLQGEVIRTFVIIKVEHYGPMNLVSAHNTFKSALTEMKEAVAKKIDSAKAAHGEDSYHAEIRTANDLNSLSYNMLAASASIDCDEESTDWGIFYIDDKLKFLLVKNIEYGPMSVLNTFDSFDRAYQALKENVVKEVNATHCMDFVADDVDDKNSGIDEYGVFVSSNKYSTDKGAPLSYASFCEGTPVYDWAIFNL